MNKKIKYLAIGVLISATIPAVAASILGRLELTWPDVNDTNYVTTIQDSITKVSDNTPARINEYTGIADNTVTTITHNFGLNNSSLGIVLYSGTGDSKIFNSLASSGFTLADNIGDPKNKIDITTPISGAPHDFSVILSWGGSSGSGGSIGGNLTFQAELFEDIAANSLVKVVDDGGTVKLASIASIAPTESSTSNLVPTENSPQVSYHSTVRESDGQYLMTPGGERLIAGNTSSGIFVETDSIGTYVGRPSCLSYNPVDDVWMFVSVNAPSVGNIVGTLYSVSVSGGTITLNSSVVIASSLYDFSCSLSYSSTDDKHLLTFNNLPNTFIYPGTTLAVVTSNGVSAPSIGAETILADVGTETHDFRSIFSVNDNAFLNTYSNGTNTRCVATRVRISGTTIADTKTVTEPSSQTCNDAELHPVSGQIDRYLLSYISSLDNLFYLRTIDLSGGDVVPVFNSAYDLSPIETPTGGGSITTSFDLTDNSGRAIFFNGTTAATNSKAFTVAGTVITMENEEIEILDYEGISGRSQARVNHIFFDLTNSRFHYFAAFRNPSKFSAGFFFNAKLYDTQSTIGILGTGGLAGQTQIATLLGGVSSSFIGKTIDSDAYMQADGTVGSSLVLIDGRSYRIGSFITTTDLSLKYLDLFTDPPPSLADTTTDGLMSTTTQTFAGEKIFQDIIHAETKDIHMPGTVTGVDSNIFASRLWSTYIELDDEESWSSASSNLGSGGIAWVARTSSSFSTIHWANFIPNGTISILGISSGSSTTVSDTANVDGNLNIFRGSFPGEPSPNYYNNFGIKNRTGGTIRLVLFIATYGSPAP